MNPQHRGFNRSNKPSSAAPLSSNTSYAINTNLQPPMPSYNSFSPDLKWHNTLPEDFTGRPKSTAPERSPAVNFRKRPSGPFENIDAILQSHVHHTAVSPTHLSPLPPTHRLGSSPLPSPTKRTRALQNTLTKTPTKTKSSNSLKSSGSGMQTPPPSSTATARKRGRPSKKLYPTSTGNNSLAQSPPQASPTKHQKLNGSQSCQSLNLQQQNKFSSQQLPDSGIAMPLDETPSNFNQKCDGNLWGDGSLDYIAGLTANSHGLEHSASFDWPPLRNNASLDNLHNLADIFTPTAPRRRQSQSSLTDEGTSDNRTFSFLEFDDHYGLEMPLDVNPNLLFSSTTNSAASSMIGGLREEYKPFAFVQQPYQHQHLQHLREQELEVQRQRQLQERISKERLRRERTIAASGGRNSRHSSVIKHSMSDGVLTGSGGRQNCRAANFNAAVLKRSCSNIGRRGEAVLVERSFTPEPPRRTYEPLPTLRRSTGRISAKVPRTRTEVVLAISPGGRAKTETTVVYESSDTEIDEPVLWDSPQESDSSFDDDIPRGLGPDGVDYTLYRQRKSADPFQDARVGPQRLNIPSYNAPNQAPPRTPTRRSPLKMPLSGSQRRVNGFAASTAAAATSTSGRLDSSPRLPTPLKSSPPPAVNRRLRERVRRASHSSLTPSQSMSVMGTPRLGSMQEVSDESEAETVVDGTDICLLEEEEEEEEGDGDAMYALRKVMMARRNGGASRVASLECTPTKNRLGSTIKPQVFLTGSSISTRSSGRHSQVHPALLRPSPVKKKLFEEQILRSVGRQRSSYERQTTEDSAVTPSKRRTRAMEKKSQESLESATRCVCGESEDDRGEMMVQCDSCRNWLHLRCVGYNRKSLPKVFECNFCEEHSTQQKYRGRVRPRRAVRGRSDDENSIASSLMRNGR